MPRRNQSEVGVCPECGHGTLTCTHNRFVKDERIDSWEHRCGDCGFRETQEDHAAIDPPDQPAKPAICPMCSRQVE